MAVDRHALRRRMPATAWCACSAAPISRPPAASISATMPTTSASMRGTTACSSGYGSGALAIIDPASRTKIAEIPLKAHPEGFQIDDTGRRIFVNVPDAGEIAVIDLAAGEVDPHGRPPVCGQLPDGDRPRRASRRSSSFAARRGSWRFRSQDGAGRGADRRPAATPTMCSSTPSAAGSM